MSIARIVGLVCIGVIALALLTCIVAGVMDAWWAWWKRNRNVPKDPPTFEVTPQTVNRLIDEIYTQLGGPR
ncbi:MAG TPA: hypothetical protein VFR23_04105 [Jiangellaceae bacterium]|nr:hypothetical protein [Jiangellaceae bacterium]